MAATRRRVRGATLVLIAGGWWAGALWAEAGQDSRLMTADGLACTFTLRATGTWTDGVPEAALDEPDLSFEFVEIDAQGATAQVIGPFGPSHIITRATGDYLHFVQMFSAGPLYTTTVLNRETTEGRFMAVHTRHEYTDVSLIGFTSRPEQYYGECEAEP